MAVTDVPKVLVVMAAVAMVALTGLVWLALQSDDGSASPLGPQGMVDPADLSPRQARFSPDGRQLVAYAWDGRAWPRLAIARGGVLEPLTGDDLVVVSFAWMPDSASLLVAHQADDRVAGLAIIDLEGEVVREVPLAEQLWIREGMVVRDDGAVAIVGAQASVQGARPTDLVEIDLQTGRTKRLTNTPVESEHDPVVIANGRLVFAGGQLTTEFGGPNGYIGLLDLEDGSVRRLTPDDQVASHPTVSPDGTRVVYEGFVGNERRAGGLWEVPVDASGEPVRIVREAVRWPWFHPNGRALVITEVGAPGRPGGLRVIELDEPAGVGP